MPPSGGFFAVALRLSCSAASAPVFLGSYQHTSLTEAPPDDEEDIVAADLAKASVTAEILGEKKGPKINILKFKNKTGYRKRQGHRAKLTSVKITAIK